MKDSLNALETNVSRRDAEVAAIRSVRSDAASNCSTELPNVQVSDTTGDDKNSKSW